MGTVLLAQEVHVFFFPDLIPCVRYPVSCLALSQVEASRTPALFIGKDHERNVADKLN
jgi:hypothetical protein